jgi:hypothetical protein
MIRSESFAQVLGCIFAVLLDISNHPVVSHSCIHSGRRYNAGWSQ